MDSLLKKIVELPYFINILQEFFVADPLRQNSKLQSFRLIPEESAEACFENNTEIETANKISKTTDLQNGVALITVLSEWKGLAHSTKSSFWCAAQNNHRRLRRVGSWWTLAGVLILALVAGIGLSYHETLKYRKVLQLELSSLEVELEQYTINSPAHIFTAREKHLEMLEKLAKQIVEESFLERANSANSLVIN